MVQPSGPGVHPARGPPAQPVYDARTRWWEPERPADGSGSLSADQVRRWREDGFLAIDGLWEAPLIAAAKAEAEAYFPRAGEEAAHSDAYVGGGADLPKDQQPLDREGRPWPGSVRLQRRRSLHRHVGGRQMHPGAQLHTLQRTHPGRRGRAAGRTGVL